MEYLDKAKEFTLSLTPAKQTNSFNPCQASHKVFLTHALTTSSHFPLLQIEQHIHIFTFSDVLIYLLFITVLFSAKEVESAHLFPTSLYLQQ